MARLEQPAPRKGRARRIAGFIVRLVTGVYVVTALLLWLFQARMIYQPTREIESTPDAAGLPYENVTFTASDGVKLTGWFVPAARPRGVVLFFHGNGGNISHRIDTLAILREEKVTDCGGVLHCFTEDRETAGKLLDLGFYISFSGIVTFRNAEQLRDAARYVPLDRILVETDSPYLAPVPHRGKENQPAMTRDVAEYMAVLKGVSIEELARVTTENFASLFHIDPARLQSV